MVINDNSLQNDGYYSALSQDSNEFDIDSNYNKVINLKEKYSKYKNKSTKKDNNKMEIMKIIVIQ